MAEVKSIFRIIDNASAPLRKITEETERTTAALNKISGTGEGLGKAKTDADQMNERMDALRQKSEQVNQSARQTQSLFGGIKEKMGGVLKQYVSLDQIKLTLGLADELTQTNTQLNFIKDKHNTVAGLQEKIYSSAQRSRSSYLATADAVAKMGSNAKAAFSGNDETIAFVEQVNKQFTIAGASQEQQAAAMSQLTQAMGNGVLKGDELNAVFSQTPGAIQAIADYMGKPVDQIQNLANEGKITSTVVKEAMLGAADQTNKKFNSMPKTFAQIWTGITNAAVTKFQPVLDKLTQIGNSQGFKTLTDAIVTGLSKVAGVVTTVIDVAVKVSDFISQNWSVIAPIVAGIGAAFMVLRVAISVAAAAQFLMNSAILTCPIVWIIAAIAAVVAVFIVLWKKCAAFRNFWKGIWTAIKSMVGGAVTAIVGKVTQIWTKITGTFKRIMDWIKDKVEGFKNLGKNIIDGLKDGFMGGVDKLKEKVGGVVDGVKKLFSFGFEINSPSKWMKRLGGALMLGMGMGIDKGAKRVMQKTVALTASVKKGAQTEVNRTVKMQGPAKPTPGPVSQNSDNRVTNNQIEVNVTVTNESDENRLVDKLRELMNNSAEGAYDL